MTDPLSLRIYEGATRLIEVGAPVLLRRRLKRGKEDPNRLGERLGIAGCARPPGPLAWVHGASVGEGLALLPFIERLRARGFAILVTTGTVTSSRVLGARLPAGVIHQFVPLDLPGPARRFFDHWRPDLVCFAESELWPNLLGEAARRRSPAILLNARMSERSFARWRRAPTLIRSLLGRFTVILAQSDGDTGRLAQLGAAHIVQTGNLKFDVAPPPFDRDEFAALQATLAGRPIWVAASTHQDEEHVCCATHQALSATFPDLLTVVVPRKSERGHPLAEAASALDISVQLRSHAPWLDGTTGLYVADTMGDLGLFYRLASIVFVGKSLVPGGGGQNPIEPAKLGCAILHGPHVANFRDIYAMLDQEGGSRTVTDGAALIKALTALLSDAATRDGMAAKASVAVALSTGATDRTMEAIEPICAALLQARRA